MAGRKKMRGELEGLTREDLEELASRVKVPGRSRMARGELLTALRKAPGIHAVIARWRAARGRRARDVAAGASRRSSPPRRLPAKRPAPPRTPPAGRARPPVRTRRPGSPPRHAAAAPGAPTGSSPPSESRPPLEPLTTAAPLAAAAPAPAPAPFPAPAPPPPRGEDAPRTPAPEAAREAVPFNEGRLVLLAIDPSRAHAYWAVHPRAVAEARLWLGDPSAVVTLRVSPVRGADAARPGAAETVDLAVSAPAGNYYVLRPSAGEELRAELGLKSLDGRFLVLARSNRVQLPRPGESPVYEHHLRRIHSPVDPRWRSRRRPLPPAAAVGGAAASNADDDDIPEARGADAALASPVEGNTSPEGAATGGFVAERPGVVESEEPRGEPPAPVRPEREGPLEVPPHWQLTFGLSSGEYAGGHVSSHELPRADGKIPIEVRAEIVVEGRTRPGVEIVIEGIQVPVDDDGTFALRFAFPRQPERRPGEDR